MRKDEQAAQIQENVDASDKLALAYQHLFATPNGKKVLEDLTTFCGYEYSSVGQNYDPNKTMFKEGQRNVYLHINNMLKRKVEKK